MEILDTTEACFLIGEDLLDFSLDGESEDPKTIFEGASPSSSSLEQLKPGTKTASFGDETQSGSFPGRSWDSVIKEFAEEELEWLSNKDAFPAVETCFGILAENPELVSNQHMSPVSVLDQNTTTSTTTGKSPQVPVKFPVKSRSKGRRRKREVVKTAEFPRQQYCVWPSQLNYAEKKQESLSSRKARGNMGRRCLHCQSDKTPQWRAGPMGPKTLCNACGVRYKSGRLLPEYRPANSPTFSSDLHSNSHRKVVEMRRQRKMDKGGEDME